MLRFFGIVLLAVSALSNSTPQPASELKKEIDQKVVEGELEQSIAAIEKLRLADPQLFVSSEYDYLLARLHEKGGNLAAAVVNYEAVASRDSPLRPYSLKRLSQISRSTGNLMLERLYLGRLRIRDSKNPIAKAAWVRLAVLNYEQANYGETLGLLTMDSVYATDPGAKPSSMIARELRALIGEAHLHAGDVEKARAIFVELIDSIPNASQPDDIAVTSAKHLDVLDGGQSGKKVPTIDPADHSKRASIFQFNREFIDAKLHYEAIIANDPSGALSPESAFQIGRGLAQQANYLDALKWFERVLEQYPQSSFAKEALLQAASAYGRVGRPKEATTRYQLFIDRYPTDEKLDRAYLNIVDIMRDQGEDTDALRACEKVREIFKGKLPEAIAAFTEARIYFAREDWGNALERLERMASFSELGGTAVPGGTSRAETSFLKAFALQKLKRFPQAAEAYISVADGRAEYYGSRATEKLREMGRAEESRSFIDQLIGQNSAALSSGDLETRSHAAKVILRLSDNKDLRDRAISVLHANTHHTQPGSYKAVPSVAGVREMKIPPASEKLTSLSLFDEAAIEIEFAYPDLSKAGSEKEILDIYKKGDRADLLIAFSEPGLRQIPADKPIESMSRDELEMLYPAPFASDLLNAVKGRDVDPRLILAIMRQESRFQPNAKSNAAARGLMQFISTTSNKVASDLDRQGFRQDDLYEPPTAILFGAEYLSTLFKAFPNQPEAVVASYNGGDDNMKRWLNRSRSNDPDRYVTEIVYAQSKDYVQKVMSAYRVYKYLYDEQLRASLP